jgi:hypothetical protein
MFRDAASFGSVPCARDLSAIQISINRIVGLTISLNLILIIKPILHRGVVCFCSSNANIHS